MTGKETDKAGAKGKEVKAAITKPGTAKPADTKPVAKAAETKPVAKTSTVATKTPEAKSNLKAEAKPSTPAKANEEQAAAATAAAGKNEATAKPTAVKAEAFHIEVAKEAEKSPPARLKQREFEEVHAKREQSQAKLEEKMQKADIKRAMMLGERSKSGFNLRKSIVRKPQSENKEGEEKSQEAPVPASTSSEPTPDTSPKPDDPQQPKQQQSEASN